MLEKGQPHPKRLLVVKNRAMGDAIIALGTLRYLKDLMPTTEIIYLTPNWIVPLFQNNRTIADRVIGFELNNARSWYETYKKVSEINPDCVFEMFQSGRTKKFFNLYALLKGIPYFAHNHHNKKGIIHDQGIIKENIQRDLDGAWTFFGDAEQPHFSNYPPQIKISPQKEKNQIILGVVATRATKMWPLQYYVNLSMILAKDYKIIIPLSKSETDQKIKNDLLALNVPATFLEAELSDLPQELHQSKLYIGNDTGIKHLCVALNIPTYTLFGPEPPKEWHPYAGDKHLYYYQDGLFCRTEKAHYCGLSFCSSMICLNQFTAKDLYHEISIKGMI